MARGLLQVSTLPLLLGLSSAATAQAPPSPEPTNVPSPAPTPMTRIERRLRASQLTLPSYARGGDPFAPAPTLPAFTDEISVTARPMDTESLTAKMAWWMNDFEPVYAGAGPARFHAPTLAEMREHRPSPALAADFTPLFGWLLGKLKKDDSSGSSNNNNNNNNGDGK